MKIINRVFIIICCGVCICLQGIDIKSVFAILMLGYILISLTICA